MSYEVVWFLINPSFDCDQNCSFCYNYGKDIDRGEMSKEVMDKIIEQGKFIVEKYHTKELSFTFLGGEPTLKLDLVKYLATRSKEIPCQTKLWLFTNGILLTNNMMQDFKELGVKVFLSANHTDIKDLIEVGDLICRYQSQLRVAIVVDMFNLSRLESITEQFYKKGWLVRYRSEEKSFLDWEYMDWYVPILSNCFKMMKKYTNEYTWLFDSMNPKVISKRSVYMIGKSILVFDPDGTVRSDIYLHDQGRLGILEEKIDYFKLMREYPNRRIDFPRWTAEGIQECQECSLVSVCQSGYPSHRFNKWGRFDKPTAYCDQYKELLPLLREQINK